MPCNDLEVYNINCEANLVSNSFTHEFLFMKNDIEYPFFFLNHNDDKDLFGKKGLKL